MSYQSPQYPEISPNIRLISESRELSGNIVQFDPIYAMTQLPKYNN